MSAPAPRAGEYLQHLTESAGTGKRPPQHEILLAVFQDNYHGPYRTPDGLTFAVRMSVPSVMLPLRGPSGLRQRLAADMWRLTGKLPSQEAQSTSLAVIEGVALDGRTFPSAVRTARAPDGPVVVDLGRPDGLAAVVVPGRWGTTTRAPVLFRRGAGVPEIPAPVPGGRLDGMRELLAIRDRDELALYVACRLMALLPEGTRPVEAFTGGGGSLKTSTTRLTIAWTGGVMANMPRDSRDWAALAANAGAIGHDNLSALSADRQDLLCKAASGHEYMARMLYSDADLVSLKFQPITIAFNGIEFGALRSDLIRRSVAHRLARPDRHLTDAEVAARWRAAHPQALGWLLDLLAAVLARRERLAAVPGDSLADFARVAAALDSLWGTDGLGFWRRSQAELFAELADADPVALAIRSAVTSPWEGTTAALLERLQPWMPALPGRPWTPQALAGRLDRAEDALRAGGWKAERVADRRTKRRWIRLWPPEDS